MAISLGLTTMLCTVILSRLGNTDGTPDAATEGTLFSSSQTTTYSDQTVTTQSKNINPLECLAGSLLHRSSLSTCVESLEECSSVLTCDGENMVCYSYLYSEPHNDVFNYTFGCAQTDTCLRLKENLQDCSQSVLLLTYLLNVPRYCVTCCDDEKLCNKYISSSAENEISTPDTTSYANTTEGNRSESTATTSSLVTLTSNEGTELNLTSLDSATDLLNVSQVSPTPLECFTSRISSRTFIEHCLSTPYSPECFNIDICSDITMVCYASAVFNRSADNFSYTSGCLLVEECQSIKGTLGDCGNVGLRTALTYNFTKNCMTCCDNYNGCNNVIPGFLLVENDERCPLGYVFDDVFHTNSCYTATGSSIYNTFADDEFSLNGECNRLGGVFLFNNDTEFLHWLVGKMNLRGESFFLNSMESNYFDALWYEDVTQTIEDGFSFSERRGLCKEDDEPGPLSTTSQETADKVTTTSFSDVSTKELITTDNETADKGETTTSPSDVSTKELITTIKENPDKVTTTSSSDISTNEYMTTANNDKTSGTAPLITVMQNRSSTTNKQYQNLIHAYSVQTTTNDRTMSTTYDHSLQTSTSEDYTNNKTRDVTTKPTSTSLTTLYTENDIDVTERKTTIRNDFKTRLSFSPTTTNRLNEEKHFSKNFQSIQPNVGFTSQMEKVFSTATSVNSSLKITPQRHKNIMTDASFGCEGRLYVGFSKQAVINTGVSFPSRDVQKGTRESFQCLQT